MIVLKRLKLGPMANFVYLVADRDSKECAVVDPAWDVPAILAAAKEEGFKLTQALVTHNHPDHVNGIPELLEAADVPVRVHAEDAYALEAAGGNLKPTRGGETIRLGSTELTFLHTPGHTEGSQCFLVEGRVLTGDTLFIGACGRVDLPGSDPEKMYHSLRRLAELPGPTEVLPGHDYADEPSARLEAELKKNLYLKTSVRETLQSFLRLVGA